MKIYSIQPRYMSNELIALEHDFLHGLYAALSGEESVGENEPELFRFNGRRGRLYVRHRLLVEEMILRGLSHTTLLDRRIIEKEEWVPMEVADEDILIEAKEIAAAGEGRFPIPRDGDPVLLSGRGEVYSAIDTPVDQEVLFGLWLRYRHLVMERSYARYRELADPLRGRGRASVWMLFDLVLEETFASDPEERAPAIAYENIWEMLESEATDGEREKYDRLAAALEPGKVSLEMRKFLAEVASRQGDEELLKDKMLLEYL